MRNTVYKNLVVRESRNGRGIFAAAHFGPGQPIFRIHGRRKHYTTLLKQGGTFLDNCFRISENYYLSPEGHIGMYLNHSCEPNARVAKNEGKLFVYAVTNIPKDTEVLIDYSTITASDDVWTMRCNCGAQSCRKIIRNFARLSQVLRTTYQTQQIAPAYIVSI